MKNTSSLFALGVLIGSACFATAQDKPKNPERKISAEALKKFDKDADGKLSDAEKADMKQERQEMMKKRKEEMLKKFDKDENGKMSDEERANMKAEMDAQRKKLTDKYDANKNGKLDAAEAATARAAGEQVPPPARAPKKGKGKTEGPPPEEDDQPPAPPAKK